MTRFQLVDPTTEELLAPTSKQLADQRFDTIELRLDAQRWFERRLEGTAGSEFKIFGPTRDE